MIQGKSYTSNNTKLLKHLDVLKGLQENKVNPIMIHLAITNICNLNCSFCCFKNRNKKDKLSLKQVIKVLDSFKVLGVKALEITGGGEPLLHPNINEIIEYAFSIGYKIGICSNGKELTKIKLENWNKVEWIRLGMYGFDQNYIPDISVFKDSKVKVSAAYVWDKDITTFSSFHNMIMFVEQNKIPTRIAVNAIKPVEEVKKDMEEVTSWFLSIKQDFSYVGNYSFLSDFNLKLERRNENCFMHLIKPFIFTDGFVYVCPSAELAEENNFNVNSEFRVCDIEHIIDFYKQPNIIYRKHKCSFCKYSSQNELIDDILTETEHNEFA
jgi:MoaA/NifB/PqqE/SkfB family radical SAM enzyme